MKSNKNGLAILLMVLSMGAFAAADALVKVSTDSMSTYQVMILLFGGGAIVFGLVAFFQGDPLLDRRAYSKILLFRYVVEIIGMLGMVTALAKVPISSVGAITQATPLVAALGAVLFLKEQVGWRRWLTIGIGFLGVLLIVQPGTANFDISILWAVLALIALSARDLNTRMIPSDIPSSSLAMFTVTAALPIAITFAWLNGDTLLPQQPSWIIILPMILLGSLGYLLLIASIRMAPVSIVMPFRYSRIIFLMVLGVLVFGETPDVPMLLGAALIIMSGVYIIWREQQLKKASNQL